MLILIFMFQTILFLLLCSIFGFAFFRLKWKCSISIFYQHNDTYYVLHKYIYLQQKSLKTRTFETECYNAWILITKLCLFMQSKSIFITLIYILHRNEHKHTKREKEKKLYRSSCDSISFSNVLHTLVVSRAWIFWKKVSCLWFWINVLIWFLSRIIIFCFSLLKRSTQNITWRHENKICLKTQHTEKPNLKKTYFFI